MKKIVSIILTAAMCAAVVPAVSAAGYRAETITGEQVKELLFRTGLCAYPELCEMTAENSDLSDILHTTAKVSDVIDINKSFRDDYTYGINDEGEYTLLPLGDTQMWFCGVGNEDYDAGIEGFAVSLSFNTEASYEPGRVRFSLHSHYGENRWFSMPFVNGFEDPAPYMDIADMINKNITGEIQELAYVGYNEGLVVVATTAYVRTADGQYAVILVDEEQNELYAGEVYTVKELVEKGRQLNERRLESQQGYTDYTLSIKGDEVRDTDTRAAYIGTESKFTDVSGTLVSYVNELHDLDIIDGYDNGTFQPENTVTRAEAAAMLARMLNYSGAYTGRFSNVAADAWYMPEVEALAEQGMISGTSDTEFSPDASITYADMFKIVMCVLGFSNDFRAIQDYRVTAIELAIENGLTEGLASFEANEQVTRGALAVILSNALDAHIYTSNTERIYDDGTEIWAFGKDITLIDYINGGRINGMLNAEH
ncbi:MAG: S-layer homology domain-containing protein [Candidatus Ornithomonoglobus sp.]